MKKSIFAVLVLMMALILMTTGCGNLSDSSNPSKTMRPQGADVGNDDTYRDVFKENKVIDISVTLKNEYYNEMMAAPEAEQFYSADINVAGEKVYNVGFRTTGATDFVGTSEASLEKYSYKVRFDKYVDKQKYLKLDEMVLINCYKDPSYMREYLSYLAYKSLDSKYAPLATYATLKINGKDCGLYLCIECVEDAYLNRVMNNNDNNLYKASEGATLESLSSVSLFEQKNGQNETKTDLNAFLEVLHAMPMGSKGNIETVLNVDSALQFIAVNAVVGNYDGYLGKNAKDYYLASNGTQFIVVPWDMNESFGAGNKDNGVTATISTDTPVYRVDMSERPLISKLLAVPEYKTKYDSYVAKLVEFMSGISAEIDKIDTLIGSYVQKDQQSFYGYDQYLINIGKSTGENTTGYIALSEYASIRADFLKSSGEQ